MCDYGKMKYPQQRTEGRYTEASDRIRKKDKKKKEEDEEMLENKQQGEKEEQTPETTLKTHLTESPSQSQKQGENSTSTAPSEEEARSHPTESADAQEKTSIQTKKKAGWKSATGTRKKKTPHRAGTTSSM